MDLAQTQLLNDAVMPGGPITFVPGKAIFGILLVEFAHHGIPGSFGKHRSRRNADRVGLAAHEFFTGKRTILPVNKIK